MNSEIIGRSSALRAVLRQVEIVAPTNATVLIEGETGTGKELIARALHDLSPRHDHPLATLNCAAIPTGLVESELFGYERGAFTGAVARKAGRLEMANLGTLFLDEVADFPPELQPKLLRVLQEKEFERLGGTQTRQANVRLVAATSRCLAQMVADRQFRNDLYYRLNVFPIRMPPLRERLEDIPLLVRYFVNKYAGQMNKQIDSVPPSIMESLKNYYWPGNIRELENYIERSVILSSGNVLRPPMNALEQQQHPQATRGARESAGDGTLEQCERDHILRALNETGWRVGGRNGASVRLGVKRTTLIWKMKKLGISAKGSLPAPVPQKQNGQ